LPIYKLSEEILFPDPSEAEDGIIAVGGDLSPERIIVAYLHGIFPWYSDTDPIIWWSPDPRCVLFPVELRVSRSMKQLLKKGIYTVTFDRNFREVIRHCADVRYKDRNDTWITGDMMQAYIQLYEMGIAHSVEVWDERGDLAGGLYGLAMGKCFFGESMFHLKPNASKYGFITLVSLLREKGYELVDCQVHNDHLESLGATVIPREIYLSLLSGCVKGEIVAEHWYSWPVSKGQSI